MEIPAATITAILGPNGSGKTTLLHLILGILAPEGGVVLLARRPRETYSRREMGQLVGLVSQNEYVPFNFTVLEYIVLGRAPHLQLLQTPGEEDLAIAGRILEQIGLSHLRDRSIQSLSGGERQLVMVARALAQHPRILLLDEPTSHLDLGNREHVLAILRQQAEQGVTVVFTTHEPNQAADVAAFVVLMRDGRVLEVGPPEEVLTSTWLTRTYGVLVEVVEVRGRRVVVPGNTVGDRLDVP
ncbi:MAG: ABC transporter ATP-binding protein [Anaerolineae bacterium]|nr:ABC transporter ATP-binding protein [Anaerolineae bacterium]